MRAAIDVQDVTRDRRGVGQVQDGVGDVLGEETVSSRLVIGVASLPLGSPVELEVILEVKMD